MRPPLDGTVLITGASSGIGRELAHCFGAEASTLVLVARRETRLQELATELRQTHPKLTVDVRPCDLLDREATAAMVEAVQREVAPVDVLVNNAGLGDVGAFDLASWSKTQRMLELNVTALTQLTHLLLPSMVKRKRGGVLQVSSGFGLQFMPGFAAYVGTKHYVTGFTESLRIEMRQHGVVISQLCPGPVRTEFEANAADFDAPEVPSAISISAEHCARVGYAGFRRDRAIIVPGLLMKTMMFFGAWTPRWFLRLMYAPASRKLRQLQLSASS